MAGSARGLVHVRAGNGVTGTRGDGLAAAYRAGARVINCEYIQFHPTTLAVPGADNFLISESVRGEGARLYTPDGRHFMSERAPKWGDLAPRDVVARANYRLSAEGGAAYLDATEAVGEAFPERFPTVFESAWQHGYDPRVDLLPVSPAAHYHMGGIEVDDDGRANLSGLWAVSSKPRSGCGVLCLSFYNGPPVRLNFPRRCGHRRRALSASTAAKPVAPAGSIRRCWRRVLI